MVQNNDIRLIQVETGKIDADPRQPRKSFEEKDLLDLGNSMLLEGQKYPIRVHLLPDGRYQVIGGERRLRAARLKGIPLLYVQIEASKQTEIDLIIDQLTENLTNKRLTLIEMAAAFQKLSEEGLTYKQIAEKVHVSEGTVSRALTVNGCLAPELKEKLNSGHLPAHEAYVVATVKNRAIQNLLAEQFMAGTLNRSQLENRAREESGKARSTRKTSIKLSVNFDTSLGLEGLQKLLQQKLDQIRKWMSTGVPVELVDQMWRTNP